METRPINERYLSVSGKVGIAEELTQDQDITVTVTVQEVSHKSNNNGTDDLIFRAKLFAPAEWDGKKITVEGGKTPSQKQRAVLFLLWEQSKTDEKFDTWYAKKMEVIIDQLKEKLES